jgi:ABC-type polysaccharide/polyol phosphate transport system ATPase subunit
VSAPAIAVSALRKSFLIPSVRRTTVREHVLGVLRPRQVESLRVLDGIDLTIAQGEAFGIMGRNGCGKSTLLKIIAGIYTADSGAVRVAGPLTPILELGLGFNPELDAIDNVLLFGGVMGLGLRELRAMLDQILAFAELERFASLELRHFSSGMIARLAYAVAFHSVRGILVLDEIFAVGDAGFKLRCAERCRELHAAGHTILLVSHDPNAMHFCERAALLSDGRVSMLGTGREICDAYFAELTGPRA